MKLTATEKTQLFLTAGKQARRELGFDPDLSWRRLNPTNEEKQRLTARTNEIHKQLISQHEQAEATGQTGLGMTPRTASANDARFRSFLGIKISYTEGKVTSLPCWTT